MKLTIEQLLRTEAPMGEILNQKLSAVTAYRLGSLINEVQLSLAPFHLAKQKLFESLGVKTSDNQYEIPKENLEAFTKEMKPLLEEEVELKYKPISVLDLGEITISPIQMAVLKDYFILEEAQ